MLRGTAYRNDLSTEQAERALARARDAPIMRVSLRPLLGRAWQFRHTVTAYDALYVAVAEELDLPLLTCAGKPAGSNGDRARIELFADG